MSELVWTGIELNFITVAHMVLDFEFATTAVLVSEQCLYRAKAFSASHPTSKQTGQGIGGTQPGQLTPIDPRVIPYHMLSCSAIKKKQGEEGGREDVQSYSICLRK